MMDCLDTVSFINIAHSQDLLNLGDTGISQTNGSHLLINSVVLVFVQLSNDLRELDVFVR